MNEWQIVIATLLGAIGMGYIVYGRKQLHAMAMISGLTLCIFPYFVHQVWLSLPIAAVVMALPRFIDF